MKNAETKFLAPAGHTTSSTSYLHASLYSRLVSIQSSFIYN